MIIFSNPGLIDLDAVTTLGVSVKQPGSFGRFGTGLKFAIATILRGGGQIALWRGLQLHEIGTVEKVIRGETFQIVTLDGDPIGITTNLGRDWEPWMVLRELGCNALDEGGYFAAQELINLPGHDETTIVVDWPELDQAYQMRGQLFLEGDPLWQSEKLRILPGPCDFLFYRGVRVFKLEKQSAFTYDVLAEQFLTEDRTLSGSWRVDPVVRDALISMDDKEIISKALTTPESYEAKLDFENCSYGVTESRAFIDAAMEARESRKSLNPSARKVIMRRVREAAGDDEIVGGGTYRRARNDAFAYAVERLDELGMTFAEDQAFVMIDELPAPEMVSMVEGGRVYILRSFVAEKDARDIAAELLIRWVDLNVEGYGMEDAVRLLSPIIINACPQFKRDEELLKEDELEEAPEVEQVADAIEEPVF